MRRNEGKRRKSRQGVSVWQKVIWLDRNTVNDETKV